MVRGGKALVKNSHISMEKTLVYSVEGTNWAIDRRSGKVTWGSGNEVAVAGITMGNNTSNTYQYPTVVELQNTTVMGYEGYWAVYADATEKNTVSFTYDADCVFNPALDPDKSFSQGNNAGKGYIQVNSPDGTAAY